MHPNIVQYFGIFQQDNNKYIVMELMIKGDLRSYLIDHKNEIASQDLLFM